jgi:hypothetical protein
VKEPETLIVALKVMNRMTSVGYVRLELEGSWVKRDFVVCRAQMELVKQRREALHQPQRTLGQRNLAEQENLTIFVCLANPSLRLCCAMRTALPSS